MWNRLFGLDKDLQECILAQYLWVIIALDEGSSVVLYNQESSEQKYYQDRSYTRTER